MVTKEKLIIFGVTAVICFLAGAGVTRMHYKKVIAETEKETASAITKIEREKNERITEAISIRDAAVHRLSELDDSNRDLTQRLHDLRSRIERPINNNPEKSYREEYTSCRKLLQESARKLTEDSELLNSGCRLFGRCASDKDSIVQMIQ